MPKTFFYGFMLQLTKPILVSDVQKAIPLAQSTYKPTPGDILIISGFGREEKVRLI